LVGGRGSERTACCPLWAEGDMPMRRFLAAALVFALAACAGLFAPEPCTQAWFKYEAKQAFAPVRRDLRRTLDQLRDAQSALEEPNPGGVVEVARAAESGLRLIEAIDQKSLPRLR